MSSWKKILLVVLIAVVAAGGGLSVVSQNYTTAQNELDATVGVMLKDLAENQWNGSVVNSYASPTLQQWLAENHMTDGLSALSSLGNMTAYQGIRQFNVSGNNAALVSPVRFESGDAIVTLALSKYNGRWLLDNVNINTLALLKTLK